MPNDENKATVQPQKTRSTGGIFGHILNGLKHNIGLKILSLFLAICVWGALLSQDTTLTRTKVITDATISVTGSDALLRNGFIVVSGLESEVLSGLRIRASVPQKYYDQVSASTYNPRVDLSKIKSAGTQVLTVQTTSSSIYGSVIDLSVSQITVQVEKYVVRSRIPVTLEVSGTAPEGYWGSSAGTDPLYVTVSGPKSQVEQISRCLVRYDVSTLPASAGTQRTACSFLLTDRSGNEISMDNISVTTGDVLIDSITVEQALYQTCSVALNGEAYISGSVKAGYHIKSIRTEPEEVILAYASVPTDPVAPSVTQKGDVNDHDSTCEFLLTLKKPSDALYMNTDQVYVFVQIEPDENTVDTP